MTITGWARFAWQADYGQFYLIDRDDPDFSALTNISDEMLHRGVFAPSTGLIVFTADSLYQQIHIAVHEAEPAEHPGTEWMSGRPWTKVEQVAAHFPSRGFGLSGPSHPAPLPGGPFFLLSSPHVVIRIAWMEFLPRDESATVPPNVISLTIWPAPPQ